MNNPEIIIVPVLFLSIVAIIKIISDNRLRRIMIEKGKLDESLKYFPQVGTATSPFSSVKWGLVLIGLGLALLLGQLFPYRISDTMTVGFMFLFAGIGFLIYYFLVKNKISSKANE